MRNIPRIGPRHFKRSGANPQAHLQGGQTLSLPHNANKGPRRPLEERRASCCHWTSPDIAAQRKRPRPALALTSNSFSVWASASHWIGEGISSPKSSSSVSPLSCFSCLPPSNDDWAGPRSATESSYITPQSFRVSLRWSAATYSFNTWEISPRETNLFVQGYTW